MLQPQQILSIAQGAACIRQGQVLLYPTETFFAIGCSVYDMRAAEQVYQVKRRAVHKPVPVIAANMQQVLAVAQLPADAAALCTHFWPGPLTLLLPALPCVPRVVTADTGTIAVRVSSHPVAQCLALEAGAPLVASSANISGCAPVTDAAQLDVQLVQQAAGVVCGGPRPAGGLPSTLIRVDEARRAHVLRQGAIAGGDIASLGYTVLETPV